MRKLLLYLKVIRLFNKIDVIRETMSEKDRQNIAHLYVTPGYKSLEKLFDKTIIAFQNEIFRKPYDKTDVQARILLKNALLFLKTGVISNYNKVIKGADKKNLTPESAEDLPDGMPLE